MSALARRPWHLAVAGLAAGLACSALPRPAAAAAVGVAAALGAAARRPLLIVLPVAFIVAGLGLGQARLAAIDGPGARLREHREIRGHAVVLQRPREGPFGWSREVELSGGARLLARFPRSLAASADAEPGSVVVVRGSFARVRGPFGEYLRSRGVAGELEVEAARRAGRRRGGLRGVVDGLRRRAERGVGAGLASGHAALLRGMVLGEDEAIPTAVRDDWRRAGLAHLLVYYHLPITVQLDGYIRVSRVNGREGDSFISPEVQRAQIKQWAKLRGVRIAAWHTDLDQSGGKLSRPGFDKALARVSSGKTGGVVVAKLDRFSRAGVPDALKLIESVIDAGGKVSSVEEGIDPTTPTGEFTMTLFLALARMQRRQIGANWKEAQRRAVERGVHIASKPPTGYTRDDDGRLEPHPTFFPHIAEVFRRKAAGASWRDLALYLREHNVESPYGTTHWQPRALSHLIANRAYLGEARSGEFKNPGAHEAIVDEQTWQAAQEAKGERPVNGMGGALLAGVLRCAGCGYVLKPDTMRDRSGEKLRLYRCRTERSSGRCPEPASVLGRVVEPFVVDRFFSSLGGMHAEGVAGGEDLHAAEAAHVRAERELAAYLQATSAADVGADAFGEGARQRHEAVEQAREALDRAREKAGLAELPLAADLDQDWPNLSIAERNQLLRAGLDAVILGRGRVPIEQRAEVVWRGQRSVPRPSTRSRRAAAA